MTSYQKKSFWPLFGDACRNLGLVTREEREAYRQKVMYEVCGVEHLADINQTQGYENIMCRLAEDSGNYELAARYAIGSVSRYRHLILERVRAIIGSDTSPELYISGILFQGRLIYRPYDTKESFAKRLSSSDDVWAEIPEATLRLLLSIVTTELRKMK